MSYPSALINAIKTNNLVVFVGAGTSVNLGLPNWVALLTKIVSSLEVDNPGYASFKTLLAGNLISPIALLNNLEENGHKRQVLDVLAESIKLEKELDYTIQNNILSLTNRVITTNYDKAFEYASERQPNIVNNDSLFKLSKLGNESEYVFKIHGDIDSPDKCILFESDYKSLYEKNESAFLLELKKILTDKVVMFVGFGLTDPYVKQLLESLYTQYNGFNKVHYIITTDRGFSNLPIAKSVEPIFIGSYTELSNTLTELIAFKPLSPSSVGTHPVLGEYQETPTECSILFSKPIDKDVESNHLTLTDELSKFDINIDTLHLSIENLQAVDCDYLFLFAPCIRNKFLIEDEYLKSRQVDLLEIDANISSKRLKCTFLFYIGDNPLVSTKEIENAIILVNISSKKPKEIINKFLYEFFRKNTLIFNTTVETFNSEKIHFINLRKGTARKGKRTPIISKYIDVKLLAKFIGRKTDVENLIRELILLKNENKILSIKASGGIGKTTIVTKAAIEISQRDHYKAGIYFIPCQSTKSFENFLYEVSVCFDLANSIKIEEQIRENFGEKDRLIILDNCETLLYLKDCNQILELITFICDYAAVVTTTRQKLNFEFEDVFELRNFTTDEGVLLFKSLYSNIDPTFEHTLRFDIVEKLLNNNPLAIKLVAKGLPANKNLNVLKNELEENIFKDEDIEQIFERPEDINIEKNKSLYYSIDYSYRQLSDKEKFIFELLALFPDGIHLESLKSFSKASVKSTHKVDDRVIKSLDDKSLLENSNNYLKLQSIISRFADYQLVKREEDLKRELYTLMFNYNEFGVKVLTGSNFGTNASYKLLDLNYNNYLKVLDVIEEIDAAKETLLAFILQIESYFRITNQSGSFLRKVESCSSYFEKLDRGLQIIEVIDIINVYWTSTFDSSYKRLQSIIPIESLRNLNIDDDLQSKLFFMATNIYDCEGFTYQLFQIKMDKGIQGTAAPFELMKIGYLKEALMIIDKAGTEEDFTLFDVKFNNEVLSEAALDKFLKYIFKKFTLEKVQATYVKFKQGKLKEKEFRELVVSNPYTKGLIELMSTNFIDDSGSKIKRFKSALNDLSHIKYYYVEAILLFSQYLKSINHSTFEHWVKNGQSLALKYKYCFLVYKYDELIHNTGNSYDQDTYTQAYAPLDKLSNYISKYIKEYPKKAKK